MFLNKQLDAISGHCFRAIIGILKYSVNYYELGISNNETNNPIETSVEEMHKDRMTQWRIDFHKALSNPERLKIVSLLAKEEQCQCDIFPKIGLSQSTVSAYLSQLVRTGILQVRREGTKKIYHLSDPRIIRVIEDIEALAAKMTTR